MSHKFVAINISLNFDNNKPKPKSDDLKSYVWTASAYIGNLFVYPYTFGFSVLKEDENRIHALIAKPGIAPLISIYFLSELNKYIKMETVYSPKIKIGFGSVDVFPDTADELGAGEAYQLAFGENNLTDKTDFINIFTLNDDVNNEIKKLINPFKNLNYYEIRFAIEKQIQWIEDEKKGQHFHWGYYASLEHTKALNFLSTLTKIGQILDEL